MFSPLNVLPFQCLPPASQTSMSPFLNIFPSQCLSLSIFSFSISSLLNIFLLNVFPSQCFPLSMCSPLNVFPSQCLPLSMSSPLNVFPSQCLPHLIPSFVNVFPSQTSISPPLNIFLFQCRPLSMCFLVRSGSSVAKVVWEAGLVLVGGGTERLKCWGCFWRASRWEQKWKKASLMRTVFMSLVGEVEKI